MKYNVLINLTVEKAESMINKFELYTAAFEHGAGKYLAATPVISPNQNQHKY